ncbi:MAG: metallophosphoesterase [Planctomyces sp.]|nr:metallophosphoesterase [Planctomyces sp.]
MRNELNTPNHKNSSWVGSLVPPSGRRLYFLIAVWPAFLALLAPFTEGEIRGRLGFLLAITALLEFIHGFRRATWADQKSAWANATISLTLGALLLSAPSFVSRAFQLLVAAWLGIDVARNLLITVRPSTPINRRLTSGISFAGYLAIVFAILLVPDSMLQWALAAVVATRIFFAAWSATMAPLIDADTSASSISEDFGFPPTSPLYSMIEKLSSEEIARRAIDRGWIFSFLLTLLAIHVGRMGFDRTFLGLMSPLFAVLGDTFAALLISFLIIIPVIAASNRITRPIEALLWKFCDRPNKTNTIPVRLLSAMLTMRLRMAVRLRLARCSLWLAISRGLQMGLPTVAFIAAIAPMWGMSWYFDTENWAAGVWNSWAAHRTDTWRAAMVEAVISESPSIAFKDRFHVHPPETISGPDFAFLVIGDPGEGDASQHILRSEYLRTVERDDVRFVVISSDVVYPTGAMRDYERNFWLPFMGTTKPVYAIPGNHDWYDALEGFAATFFEPKSAAIAMRARVDADRSLSASTDSYVDGLVHQASQLRKHYQIPTQQQQAPYFQFQTETFAFFAVDTGVTRKIDNIQLQWLTESLEAAHGKTKMVVLGHPFYAGGRDTTVNDEDFQSLRQLLQKHDVAVIMAGDTHDLEYYREDSDTLHFVNGGGGAYLSFGTSLDWPEQPVTDAWSYYPRRDAVISKIEATTPFWKRPVWIWTKEMGGWPFSAEWLSAAFDVNAAPFYQSFVEVRVEPSQQRLRIVPHGIHGPLRRRDFDSSDTKPDLKNEIESSDDQENDLVEWVIPMPAVSKSDPD